MTPTSPAEFERLIGRVARALRSEGISFVVIGGQAVLLHGSARATEDIDITVGGDPSILPAVRHVCTALSLVPLPSDVEAFVSETFVLPTRDQGTAARVDFIFSNSAFEQNAIARAERVAMDGEPVPFATAEDLLIFKLFAGRPRDLEDAAGIVRRKGEHLDWNYIAKCARAFSVVDGCERMPEQVEELRRALPNDRSSRGPA